jgi:U3 small nucleolar RNA-associated protein MPP10
LAPSESGEESAGFYVDSVAKVVSRAENARVPSTSSIPKESVAHDDDDGEDEGIDDEISGEESEDGLSLEDDDDDDEEGSDEDEKKEIVQKKRARKSVVDDKFFKLSEAEEFLDMMDREEERRLDGKAKENEDVIDYFSDLPGDEVSTAGTIPKNT